MSTYIDGFVIPVPKKNLKAYWAIARVAKKVWLEHGALSYVESVGDDLNLGFGRGFPAIAECGRGETVVFSWITYKSKAHRDRVNKKIMADPRMQKMCNAKKMPFDVNRMARGGFKAVVEG